MCAFHHTLVYIYHFMIIGIITFIVLLLHQTQAQYNYNPSSFLDATWMQSLNNGIPVRKLSMIGTHSSMGTGAWGDAFQTQSNSLMNQMRMGVRALDIRCRHFRNRLQVHDRLAYLNANMGDVLNVISTFLSSYSSQTILMHIVQEYNPSGNNRSFEQTLISYINSYTNIIWKPTTQNPILGEVRGKVVILQDFTSLKIHGLFFSTFKVLNHKNFGTNWDLYDKWIQVKTSLSSNNAAGQSAISFWTGNTGSFPYFVASGKSSPWNGSPRLATFWTTPGFSKYYPDFPRVACILWICSIVFQGINVLGYSYLLNNNLKYLGIIYTDFAGDNLIQTTIALNINKFVPCPSTEITQGCTYCDNANKCLGCNTTLNYIYDIPTFSCKANKGYYLSWINATSNLASPCNTFILGCLQCLSASQCTLCSTYQHFQLSNQTCIAAPGYYLDTMGIPTICNIVGCYICASDTICGQCSVVNNFIITPSQTCTCDTAALFRLVSGTCICQAGYFLNSNKSCEPIPLCPANNSGCLSCNIGSPNSCAVCDSNSSFQFASFNPAYCTCTLGNYFDGALCQNCNDTLTEACVQCLSADLCIQCLSNFSLFNGQCSCKPPYFLMDSDTCHPCSFGCLLCESEANCLLCDTQNNFTLLGTTCQCIVGMFLDSTTCELCGSMPGCLDCNSLGCISCDPIIGFSLNTSSAQCQCSYGYFINNNSVCEACTQLGCVNCLETYYCIECDNQTFYLSGSVCQQICGDGKLFMLECDDNNVIDGDGCSSSCKVERDYTCVGGTNTNASACSYSGPIYIVTKTYKKHPTANTVYLIATFSPNLPTLSLIDFNAAFFPTFLVSAAQTTFDNETGVLQMRFDYNSSLNDQVLTLDFIPPATPEYFYMQRVSLALPQTTDNNLALKVYSDEEYSQIYEIEKYFTILSIASAGIFLLCFFFCSKLIAVEFIFIYQLSFASLILIKKLQIFMKPMTILWITNGYNRLISAQTMALPSSVRAAQFNSDFIANCHFDLLVIIIPILTGLVFVIVGKIGNKSHRILGYRIWKQWLLSVFLFVQTQLNLSFMLQIYYNGAKSINITFFLLTLAIFVTLMILFIVKPNNFGQYKECFNADSLSQNWYLLAFAFRSVSTFLIICLGQVQSAIYVLIGLSAIYMVFVAIKRPYKANTRPILNSIFMITVLGMLSISKIYQDSSDSTFISKNIAFFILGVLYLILLVNIIWIILKIIQKFKIKRLQQAYKNNEKQIEYDDVYLNEIKERLKVPLQFHGMQNDFENESPRNLFRNKIINALQSSKMLQNLHKQPFQMNFSSFLFDDREEQSQISQQIQPSDHIY